MTAKLCILAVAVAVIARTRVTLLPGWQVPLAAVLLAATLAACAALTAWLILRARRPVPTLTAYRCGVAMRRTP